MSTSHDGEIIVKETFVPSSRVRLYVKPPDQTNVVVVDYGENINIYNWLISIFLPQGYPNSVSNDYIAYQKWDTAQAFCSTISGILATQEVLRGVGVGDTNATPLAATITWILKDGCGHVGRILFAYSHGTYLDAYSKKWRIYADVLNNAAMCIEIALPLFKLYSTFALCISTVMKSIVGVAGGATRVAMTQHHAIRGNLADVSAKDSAQETAVNLVASLSALFIITTFGSSLSLFMLMIILHVTFNYLAVRAVCLRTFNEPRFLLAIDKYLKQEIIASPCEINKLEPIIFYHMGPCILDLKLSGFKIKIGHSLMKILKLNIEALDLKTVAEVYQERNYILMPVTESKMMYIILKRKAEVDDVLCSYFHAILLSIATCAINDQPSTRSRRHDTRPFAHVCHTLQAAEWSRQEVYPPHCGFAYAPSYELMRYLDKVVEKEWPRVREAFIQTGWDLTKHLFIVEQWRIDACHTEAKPASDEKYKKPEMRLEGFSISQVLDEIDEVEGMFNVESEGKWLKISNPSTNTIKSFQIDNE